MNIKPIAHTGAGAPLQVTPMASSNALKARAIAAFESGTQAPSTGQEHPVANPNAVSVEELGAIRTAPVEEPAQEVSAEVVQEEPKKVEQDPALKRQFEQLARQERALRAKQQQQDQAIKAREAALVAREAQLTAKDQEYQSGYIPLSQLKNNPLGVLERAGITYDQLTEQLLNPAPKNPQYEATISEMQAKIDTLMQKIDGNSKTYQDSQTAAYQSAVKQIEVDAKSLVNSNPSEYEAIIKTNSILEIRKLIEETYNKDGILMSVEEAAQEVENYLMEESYNTISRIDKLKKRLAQASAAPAKTEVKTQAAPQQTQMKTLTNATSSSRQLSARERALLAFKGELK